MSKNKAPRDYGTNELHQHGDFDFVEVRPKEGLVARNMAPDTVARMYRAGKLDQDQLIAAEQFLKDFDIANLSPHYQSVKFDHVPGNSGGLNNRVFEARDRVHYALASLDDDLQRSVVWHVVGVGLTLQEAGLRTTRSKQSVSRAVQSALDLLSAHYLKKN